MKIQTTIIIIISVIIGYVSIYYLGHDNKIEERCEETVKDVSGLDLDLTPSSPEINEG